MNSKALQDVGKNIIFRSCLESHHYSPSVRPLVYSRYLTSPDSLNLKGIRDFSILHSNKIYNFENTKNIRSRW
jgi:hypothetical protein